MTGVIILILIVLFLLLASIRVIAEYERAVIFRLGRLIGFKGPGLFILIPFIDRMVRSQLADYYNESSTPGHHYER